MTQLLSGVDAPSDAELISRVRGGDTAAYGELFSRHVDAARRLGRQLVRGPDADDLVSEAFAKMLQILQSGGGPDVAFRAYLLTSVRRLHVDRIRASSKVQTSDDMAKYDSAIPFQDPAVTSFDNGAAARAFRSLPERWQLVLWHLEVEGQKPADIAPLLGMSANSVSALAYRAREGLRQAFLTMHLADSPTQECRWVNEHLGGYVRKGLSRRDTAKVEEHLDECRRCTAMYLELSEVNSNLAGVIGPLLLGGAAAGYLSSSSGVGIGFTGVSSIVGRVRDVVAANGGVAVGGAVAAGVAAVTTTAFLFGVGGGPGETITDADRPIGIAQTPTPSAEMPSPSPAPTPRPTPTSAEVAPALEPAFVETADTQPEPLVADPVPDAEPTAGPDPVTTDPVVPPADTPPTRPPTDTPPDGEPPPTTSTPPTFGFAERTATATASGDGTAAGAHEYSLTLTLNGVPTLAEGSVVLSLQDPQEQFCTDTCSVSRDATVSVSDVDTDGIVVVPLVLWLPGQGSLESTLEATLEGTTTTDSITIIRPPVSGTGGGGAGGAVVQGAIARVVGTLVR